ncbi:lysophospholipid acyltransferase family protein [Roseomonas sp. BN140053]|uniref:lysophospholipid acyltransferase family protein n=1 Tax=Roseomonas sp. BN140053 TaxID=3391898 RepID=UPI0039E74CE0
MPRVRDQRRDRGQDQDRGSPRPGLRGRIRHAARTLLFFPVLLSFAAICLAWSLPAGLLYRLLPRPLGTRLGRWGISAGFRLYLGLMRGTGMLRCDLSALDALRGERGLVIACNHPSLLDAVLVISRLPHLACIAKASVWDNPLLGGGVRLAGYVRNDATRGMIRQAAAALRAGEPLLVFPEGTRTTRPPLGPVSRSFAVIAQQAGAAVQCVIIESDSPYLRKGTPLLRRPALPLRYRVRLGPRFPAGGRPQELSDRVAAALRAALDPAEGGRA